MLKKYLRLVVLSLITASILIYSTPHIPIIKQFHYKIYDAFMNIKYKIKGPPRAISDVLLVIIDNGTFNNMKDRWPYPRSVFAKVIENLKKGGARVIGLDFVFYGRSQEAEDAALAEALKPDDASVVLGAAINENSKVSASNVPEISASSVSGVATKIQDSDTVVRNNLTYLICDKEKKTCVLSWEMQLLKMAKAIDISTLSDEGSYISFSGKAQEKWVVPVKEDRKSFLINFRSHTKDFTKLSFYDVLKGDFDSAQVKDKIVLIGFLSSVFWDYYTTPIGPLPGITLNANAFLTLYTHDFLTPLPKPFAWFLVIIGVILASIFIASFKMKKALFLIIFEILIFLTLSLALFILGYVWNYSLFPIAVLICPILSKKLIDITGLMWLNKTR